MMKFERYPITLVCRLIAAICLTLPLVPSLAQTAESQGTVAKSEPTTAALARTVVVLNYPRERTLEESVQAFENSFRESFAKNEKSVALNFKHPGLLDALVETGRSEWRRALEDEVEEPMITELSRQLQSKLSHTDLRLVIDFYESPAGQAFRSLDPASMNLQTGLISVASLSFEDRVAIGEFQRSPAGLRYYSAKKTMYSQIGPTMSSLVKPFMPQILASIQSTARRFVASHASKPSGS